MKCANCNAEIRADAKDLVETAPNPIWKNISKREGEEIKAKLEMLGATVELT